MTCPHAGQAASPSAAVPAPVARVRAEAGAEAHDSVHGAVHGPLPARCPDARAPAAQGRDTRIPDVRHSPLVLT
ncbi:hypothetical protein GCM10009654_44230 [Streptomyces hebeiensis]|uniref:Uncharacterized protein n=1 Tax=Streptomyces hebeiensis TaxID=229486 RepID=A0ABN1UYN6_9ACTN